MAFILQNENCKRIVRNNDTIYTKTKKADSWAAFFVSFIKSFVTSSQTESSPIHSCPGMKEVPYFVRQILRKYCLRSIRRG